jgi:hypothetical protein
MRGPGAQRGQASVELVLALPVLVLLVGALWQAAVAGQAAWTVGAAARAAARARAVGADPEDAARRSLPRRLERGLRVTAWGDGVRVAVGVPAVVGGGALGTISARAAFASQAP